MHPCSHRLQPKPHRRDLLGMRNTERHDPSMQGLEILASTTKDFLADNHPEGNPKRSLPERQVWWAR